MTDNKKVEELTEEESMEESFAELFEESQKTISTWMERGQKITAKSLKVTSEWVFIDSGQKGEGVIDAKEFLDLDGNITLKAGESVTAYFLSSSHGEMRFTTRLGGGASGNLQLETAWQTGVPVEGLVEKEVKGGYEIKLSGTSRAFCPFSQIVLRRTDNPEPLINTKLTFRITEYSENGRNIIVSRRVLLEEEQRRLKEEVKAGLTLGDIVSGTVMSIQSYGAFVDIGGVEGLLPISELGWTRVNNVTDILHVGQTIKVALKSIDTEKDRISLSLKDTLADPWESALTKYQEGSFHTGTVSRLATFGAFITLADGIDGLIHISKLGVGKRINHPREVVAEGEMLEVKVESVDFDNRRIALIPAGAARAADEEENRLAEFRQLSANNSSKGMGTLADLMANKRTNKKY